MPQALHKSITLCLQHNAIAYLFNMCYISHMKQAELYLPEQVNHPDAAIVYFNHVGSSIAEDTGRDAVYLANNHGVPVIAVNRPGSARSLPYAHASSLALDYQAAVHERVREHVSPILASEELAGSRVVLAARSAGGLAALAAGTDPSLDLRAVVACEPVGMYRTTVEEGQKHFAQYNARQSAIHAVERANPEGKIILPEAPGLSILPSIKRGVSIVGSFVTDKSNNAGVWSQELAPKYAEEIARNRPDVGIHITFAEDSMVASDEQIDALRNRLAQLRTPNDAPISVEQAPHTTHASFDKRSFFAEHVKRALR